MRLLLKMNSVMGMDPAGREARRSASRMIVGMQEILDGICKTKVDNDWDFDFDGGGVGVGGVVFNWDHTIMGMKAAICK
ncbi:BAG family molecular chaperone regulator 5, mitochondrial [Linum grandiflorum]